MDDEIEEMPESTDSVKTESTQASEETPENAGEAKGAGDPDLEEPEERPEDVEAAL